MHFVLELGDDILTAQRASVKLFLGDFNKLSIPYNLYLQSKYSLAGTAPSPNQDQKRCNKKHHLLWSGQSTFQITC